MKKTVFISAALMSIIMAAQTGNVGINNTTPLATLDIASKLGSTNGTSAFRIQNSAGSYLLDINDAGSVVLGRSAIGSNNNLSIYSLQNMVPFFGVEDVTNNANFLKYYSSVSSGTYSPSNFGGQALVFSGGDITSGLYIGTVSNVAGGIFIGNNGYNGIGLTRLPTEKLDIGGNLTIGGSDLDTSAASPVENGSCAKPGEISYNYGFWGCTNSGWKRLDK